MNSGCSNLCIRLRTTVFFTEKRARSFLIYLWGCRVRWYVTEFCTGICRAKSAPSPRFIETINRSYRSRIDSADITPSDGMHPACGSYRGNEMVISILPPVETGVRIEPERWRWAIHPATTVSWDADLPHLISEAFLRYCGFESLLTPDQ